jgi:hypothetical protein
MDVMVISQLPDDIFDVRCQDPPTAKQDSLEGEKVEATNGRDVGLC